MIDFKVFLFFVSLRDEDTRYSRFSKKTLKEKKPEKVQKTGKKTKS